MRGENDSWMAKAIREARKGIGLTAPNPPVGAVIVKGERILGKGWHRRAGEPHAEIEAIRAAIEAHGSNAVRGSTIYVTLEPCSTKGKTPACTKGIIEAGIQRVVFGARDPNPAHANRAGQILNRAKIDVTAGVLEPNCNELIRPFRKHMETGLPWLISKSALSLDGRITRPAGQSQWLTGEEARKDVHRLRSQVDAVLIGGNTARNDNPQLTVRGEPAKRRRGAPQPWRVVMTRQAKLPDHLHLLSDQDQNRTILYRNQSLKRVLRNLGNRGCLSVLLESGGDLTGQAFESDLVDEIIWYLAPSIFCSGVPVTELKRGIPPKWTGLSLNDLQVTKIGEDLRISALVGR